MLLTFPFQMAVSKCKEPTLYDIKCNPDLPISVCLSGDSLMANLAGHLSQASGRMVFHDHSQRGATIGTYSASPRFHSAVSCRATIKILWIGSNNLMDRTTGFAIDNQLLYYAVKRSMEQLSESGAIVYLIALPNRYFMDDPRFMPYRRLSAAFNRHFERFLGERFIKLPPSAYEERNYARDGVHLSADVLNTLARKIRRVVRAALR